jgi:hypothetical protein
MEDPMKRPKQLPAVDRNPTKTAALPAGAGGVRPSFDWWGAAQDVLGLGAKYL